MNDKYWLLMPYTALALLLIASLLYTRRERIQREEAENYIGIERYKRFEVERQLAACKEQQDMLLDYVYDMEDAVTDIAAFNADLHDALKAAQDKIKMIQQQTVELPEVAQLKAVPKRPARTTRKRKDEEKTA